MENESFQSLSNLVSLAKDDPGPIIAEIINSAEKNIEFSSTINQEDSLKKSK